MAALSDVLTYARVKAQTDSNGLTDADGIVLANEALFDIRRKMIKRGVDAAQVQESYRDMTADTGTYLYPTDMHFLKAIELDFTGSGGNNFVKAEQVDVSNISGGESFSDLRLDASQNSPKFDDRGDHFEIFPTPTGGVSEGIRIFYYLEPTAFSTTADAITYPESLDYRIMGKMIAGSYLKSIEKLEKGSDLILEYETELDELLDTLSRGTQQPITVEGLGLTGYEF